MANRIKFTPKAQAKFIEQLMMGDTMVEAAEEAGVHVRTVYDHKTADPDFAALVEMANEIGCEANLVPVAINRARDGWDEPVFHQGEECGTIRRFDNGLLWKIIQAKSKAYRAALPRGVDLGESILSLAEELKLARQRSGVKE